MADEDIGSPKSVRIDKSETQSAAQSAKSGNKSLKTTTKGHAADMMPGGFETMC